MLAPFLIGIALQSSGQVFDLKPLVHAPEAQVIKLLGPKHVEKRLPYVYFLPKGCQEARFDNFGPKMKRIHVRFLSNLSWSGSLNALGLSAHGVKATFTPAVKSPLVVQKNDAELAGVTGLSGGPWRVHYDEFGVVNKKRTAAIRTQIRAASGEARTKLIQSCYDWCSELIFTSR